MTAEELAAAVEAQRQQATPERQDAMRQALRTMGIDPARIRIRIRMLSLKSEGGNNGKTAAVREKIDLQVSGQWQFPHGYKFGKVDKVYT